MPVANRIGNINNQKQQEQVIEYTVGDTKIKLTKSIIKRYLVSGDPNAVTDEELVLFMMLCRDNKLDPWTHEAYLIKYGSDHATMVMGKEAFMKRAAQNPAFNGMQAGIIVADKDGNISQQEGAIVYPGYQLLGGWARVYRKDREYPFYTECDYKEYVGTKSNGQVNRTWAGKAATMIRKVAVVNALREAFPAIAQGIYTAEEQGENADEIEAQLETAPASAKAIEETSSAQPVPAVINARQAEPVQPAADQQHNTQQMQMGDSLL